MFAPIAYAAPGAEPGRGGDRPVARGLRAAIADWLRVVGEVEALSALATYAFEHPGDPFPELVDAGAMFEATGSVIR